MVVSEGNRTLFERYFKYTCLEREIKTHSKYMLYYLIFVACFLYLFEVEWNSLTSNTRMMKLAIMVILGGISGYQALKEFFSIIKNLILYNSLDGKIEIEKGKIKYLNLNRVETRVTVQDNIGDIYIARYADEFVADLYVDDLPVEVECYIIYLKDSKNKYMSVYPCKYILDIKSEA